MTQDSNSPIESEPGGGSGSHALPEAREALAAIQAARAGAPGSADYPLGYDLLYGTACALIVAGPGLPSPWSLVTIGAALAALALLVRAWRRRFGWWTGGYSPRRARWVAFGMVAVLFGLVMLANHGRETGSWWPVILAAGAGFFAAIFGSRLWMRVWRAELAGGLR